MTEKFSKIGFILAVAGSAVGLGNAWKFPTLVGQNGGSAFILLYLILTLCVSFVIFLSEIVIGRLAKTDAVGAFKKLSPKHGEIWKFAGFFMVGALLIYSFYSVVIGWILKYMVTSVFYLPTTIEESGANFGKLISGELGINILCFTICSLTCFYIVSKGVKSGIEKVNIWIMPTLFIMLILMLGYSMSANGFWKAANFLLVPDFSVLNPNSVLLALGLAFFTLSLGVTVILTYAASLPPRTNILTSSLNIVFINILIGVMMGLIVFTFVFEFGSDPSQSGPGLIFVSLTMLFSKLGIVGNILAFFFFLSLFFAAITSAISMLEPAILYLIKNHNFTRIKAIFAIFIFTYFFGILSILGSYEGTSSIFTLFDKNVFDNLDYLTSNIMMPVSGIITAIFVGFVVKKDLIYRLFKPFMGKIGFEIWYFLLKFIAPIAVLIVMLENLGVLKGILKW